MRIVFTADLHLDCAFLNEDSGVRNRELIDTFKYIADFASREGIGAVVIGGDLFDTPTPSDTVQSLVRSIIESHRDIKFYAVAGNHDPLFLTAFYNAPPENLYVFPDTVTAVDIGGALLYGASVRERTDCRNIWQDVKTESGAILVCHGTLDSEGGFYLSRDAIERTGAELVLMGHIHKPAEYLLSGPRALYCGTPAGRGFDECGERGFYVVDTDSKNYTFHKTEAKIYSEYNIDVTGCDDITEVLSRINSVAVGENEIARAVLSGDISGEFSVDCDALLPYALRFVEIKDKTKVSVDIMKNADANTLEGEFIRILSKKLESADQGERQMILDAIKEGVTALRCNK